MSKVGRWKIVVGFILSGTVSAISTYISFFILNYITDFIIQQTGSFILLGIDFVFWANIVLLIVVAIGSFIVSYDKYIKIVKKNEYVTGLLHKCYIEKSDYFGHEKTN